MDDATPSGHARWGKVELAVAVRLAPHRVALAVYVYVACHANRAGEAWPAKDTIAGDLEITRPTLRRALRLLSELGALAEAPIVDARGVTHLGFVLLSPGPGDARLITGVKPGDKRAVARRGGDARKVAETTSERRGDAPIEHNSEHPTEHTKNEGCSCDAQEDGLRSVDNLARRLRDEDR